MALDGGLHVTLRQDGSSCLALGGLLAGRMPRAASLLVVGLIVLTLSEHAVAQTSSREVFIGGFATRAAEPDTSRDAQHARSAAHGLADALVALERGDVMIGRRQLEQIVVEYPGTLAASTARRELDQLLGVAPPGGVLETTSTVSPDPRSPVRTSNSHSPAGADHGRGIDARRRRALALDFQVTAGDRVFFGEAAADLGARARWVLAAQARWLLRNSDLPIVVEAHADDHGSREFNLDLSQRRGNAVRDRLIEEGVAPGRIAVRAFGSDKPVAICRAAECAAQNRRVVVGLTPVAPPAVTEPRYPASGFASGPLAPHGRD